MKTECKTYRGYELSATCRSSSWHVQIWPTKPELPFLDPADQHVSHRDLHIAFARACRHVDRQVGIKCFSRHSFHTGPAGAGKSV